MLFLEESSLLHTAPSFDRPKGDVQASPRRSRLNVTRARIPRALSPSIRRLEWWRVSIASKVETRSGSHAASECLHTATDATRADARLNAPRARGGDPNAPA